MTADAVVEVTDGFEAELWASNLMATWRREAPPGEPVEIALFRGLVQALKRLRTAPALAALRALSTVGAPTTADVARGAAEQLAAAGLPEPAWEAGSRPVAAVLLDEPAFDDGVSVMVEFAEPDGALHTISVYIDHNLGGLVKDVFIADALADVRASMENAPDNDRVAFHELDLGEARARIEDALYLLDHMFDAPVDDEVHHLRALIEARMRLLPEGPELPDTRREFPQDERDALLADFLDAEEGRRWRGDEEAEYIAQLAIDFGADYNHDGPLRWSAVVVELFMLDWLGRKITEEPEFFERVPDVLATWVRYAGRRRGVPAHFVDEPVAAVAEYRDEMLATVGDPDAWGPAKVFATAAKEAGVDLSDPEAVEQFIQLYRP